MKKSFLASFTALLLLTACSEMEPTNNNIEPETTQTTATLSGSTDSGEETNNEENETTPSSIVAPEDDPIDVAAPTELPEQNETGTSIAGNESTPIELTVLDIKDGDIYLAGVADVFEGNVVVVLKDKQTGEETVEFTTASCSMGCRGDWATTLTDVKPGTYTIILTESDPSGGEGKEPTRLEVKDVKVQ